MLIRMMLTGTVLTLTTAAALAYGMYDGTYRGNLIGISNHASSCSKTAPVRMTVTDDKLTYVHLGHTTIVATISSDGSFSGSAQSMYSDGLGTPQVQTLQAGLPGAPFRPRPTLVTVARID